MAIAAVGGLAMPSLSTKENDTQSLQSVIAKGFKEIVGRVMKTATDHVSRNKHTLYEEWK